LRPLRSFAPVVWLAIAVACVGSIGRCAAPKTGPVKRYIAAPTALPRVEPEMNTAGFWIGRLDQPDRIILDAPRIEEFNRDVRDRLGLTKDIAAFPETFDGNDLRAILHRDLRDLQRRTLYAADGHEAGPPFYDPVQTNMQLDSVDPTIDVTFAMVIRNADQRWLPTGQALYAVAGDIDFDEIQNNALDLGTPVAILHRSDDGGWCYAMGPSSDGWIRADHLAICPKKQLTELLARPFATVVRAKGNLYLDRALTQYHGFVRMGSKLPLARDDSGDVTTVVLPTRNRDGVLLIRTGYLKRTETVTGHLPYTPRHIIEQAFEMLDTPYGWGSMNGQQDCSGFVQAVFATVGVALPRNSSDQSRAGRLIAEFTERASNDKKRHVLVTQTTPATSLLFLRGHVLLYLGDVAGRPYVIHDTWGYRSPDNVLWLINRVAVTDLDLGQGSKGGSSLRRLVCIRSIE